MSKNFLRFLIVFASSILAIQVSSQEINNTKSGQAAVEGFLKTTMANYANESKEMLSYMLPSFLANNPHEKVGMFSGVWKYDIEKTAGNIFYVAVFISPDNKSNCRLMTFRTQAENGIWYLVPHGMSKYTKGDVDPWEIIYNGTAACYIPGTGPYLSNDTLKEIVAQEVPFKEEKPTHIMGMSNANSGLEAVKGFLETIMAKYGKDSEEVLSYLLPSIRANNVWEKVNIHSDLWKYDIEKKEGNSFYVALYVEPEYKSNCNRIILKTQEENGHWYLVPFENPYYKSIAEVIVIGSRIADYVPARGPYLGSGTLDKEEAASSEWDFLDNNNKGGYNAVGKESEISKEYLKQYIQTGRDRFKDKLEIIQDKELPYRGEEFNIRLATNQKLVVTVFKAKYVTDINTYTLNGGSLAKGAPKIELFRYDDEVRSLEGDLIYSNTIGEEDNEPVLMQIKAVHKEAKRYSSRNHVSHLRVKVTNAGANSWIVIAKGKPRMGPP